VRSRGGEHGSEVRDLGRELWRVLLHAGRAAGTQCFHQATTLARGLVNRVVPALRLDEEVHQLVQSILAKPPAVIAAGKKAFYEQVDENLAQAYRIATAAMLDNLQAEDGKEGVAAFAEKRKPRWKDK
jgi:enoyl-CoA hydratase/carnithine racemase